MKKNKCLTILFMIFLLTGCGNSKIENHTIIENIILNKSTYKDVNEVLDIQVKKVYDENQGIYVYSEYYAEYCINGIDGILLFYFDDKSNKLLSIHFNPKDYSKESGEALRTWIADKYSDYECETKDSGFIYSNGLEIIELYMTENPIDDTKYYGLYIEWSIEN